MVKLRQINSLTYLFEDTNKVQVFRDGLFITTQVPTADIVVGAMEVGVLSVLTSKDYTELGIDCKGTFKRYTQNYELKDLLALISVNTGFIKQLYKTGVIQGKEYQQRLFIYPSTVSISLLLHQMRVELKEVH